MSDVGTSNTVGGAVIASGKIGSLDDLDALDAALPTYVSMAHAAMLVLSVATEWPSWFISVTHMTSLDSHTVAMRFEGSIGGGFDFIELGAFKALLSGIPPNPVHDAVLAGAPITWQLKDTTPTYQTVATAAGDAAKAVADTAGQAAGAALDKATQGIGAPVGFLALAVIGLALLGRR